MRNIPGNEGEHLAPSLVEAQRLWNPEEISLSHVRQQAMYRRSPSARSAADRVPDPSDRGHVPATESFFLHRNHDPSVHSFHVESASLRPQCDVGSPAAGDES